LGAARVFRLEVRIPGYIARREILVEARRGERASNRRTHPRFGGEHVRDARAQRRERPERAVPIEPRAGHVRETLRRVAERLHEGRRVVPRALERAGRVSVLAERERGLVLAVTRELLANGEHAARAV